MTRRTIYDSEDIRITQDVLEGASSVIVFFSSFKEADWQAVAGREDTIRFRGHSGVFVTAKSNHWWQVPDLAKMCACIRAATRGYSQRIVYGSSKGAFGALLLSSDIDATRVIAVAPQTAISDPALPILPVWREAIAQRPILRDNVAESLKLVPELMYDPHKGTDKPHIDALKARVEVTELRFPFGGHKLLRTFKEAGILGSVMGRVFDAPASEAELHAIFDPAKRRSASYLHNHGSRLAEAGDFERARSEARALEAVDPVRADNLKAIIDDLQAAD
ncbi:hypothetical protein [Pararhodobacter marinus]|uniref:hypothetical protein n=1 Tax=Pararhodobacter marinus TaxID=2184063 RepID=UPI0035141536